MFCIVFLILPICVVVDAVKTVYEVVVGGVVVGWTFAFLISWLVGLLGGFHVPHLVVGGVIGWICVLLIS